MNNNNIPTMAVNEPTKSAMAGFESVGGASKEFVCRLPAENAT